MPSLVDGNFICVDKMYWGVAVNGGKIFVICFTMLFGDGEIRVYEREGILLAVSLLVG